MLTLARAGRFVINKEKLQEVLFSVPNLEGFPVRSLACRRRRRVSRSARR
jgi:hypothetical protein